MDQSTALNYARGMMDNGMSLDDANVEIVRMMGVRLVSGGYDRRTRAALMAGVKDGRIGHLKKDGAKPEAFFHPNSKWRAMDMRAAAEAASIRAVMAVCV